MKTVVYTPQSPLADPIGLVCGIFIDILKHKELIWTLFLRDLKAQFRQSYFGYLWLLAPPVFQALVWYLLNSQKMIIVDSGIVPYAIYALLGTTLWTAFTGVVLSPNNAFENNKLVFVKLNIPLEIFILADLLRAFFNFLVMFSIFFVLLLSLGIWPSWTCLLFPFAALTLLMIGFACGLVIAPVGLLYKDFSHSMTPFLAVLMFSAPVVFSIPNTNGLLKNIMLNNPLTAPIMLARESLFMGEYDWLGPCFVWFCISFLISMISMSALRIAKPHIVARSGM